MSKNSTSSTSRSRLENPATFLGLAAGYFLFQTILRSFISPVADLDESEQLIFTQSFQWGYSAHPPLYTWLQMAVFKVFGPSILGLAVLKNMLLFGCYALIFGAAWRITRNVLAATVTGLSLIFIPQISWESQRDLTHSVLASALTAATVLSFFKAHESKHLRHYALLGLCFGLGMLSNYNYAVIALAMLAAAALMREFRPVILHPFMLLAVLVGLGLAAPHFLWAMDHSSVALGSVSELHRQPRTWHANAAWSALKLLSAWFSHIAAFAAAMLLLCWREWTPWRNWLVPAASRFIAATLGIFLLFAYVALLLSEATAMRGRWLQPAYVLLPLFAGAILGQRVQAATARRVVIAAGVVAVSISVALWSRVHLAPRLGRAQDLNVPFATLTTQHANLFRDADLIIADGKFTGGNLRLLFPQAAVATPQYRQPLATNGPARALLVFDARRTTRIPAPLRTMIAASPFTLPTEQELRFVELPMDRQRNRTARFGLAKLRAAETTAP